MRPQLQPRIETYYSLAICWLSIKTPEGKQATPMLSSSK